MIKWAPCHPFIWVTVYKTIEPRQSELDLLALGLQKIEGLGLGGTEFKASHYSIVSPPKGSKAILLAALNKDATTRLLRKRTITVRTGPKSATFFLQGNTSWGSHIVVDIHRAGKDFEKDVLPKFYQTFKSAIGTDGKDKKGYKEGYVRFTQLRYYQVPWGKGSHEGSRMIVCNWELPDSIGTSSKGVLTMHRPPFCPHCIAPVHEQALCEWWNEGLTSGSKTKPKNSIKVDWIEVGSISMKKLK
ncbi:hypothetical protein FRC01_011822 [Tulasnella sp. 417]|nr:hypothetical protein FRC01_011822 [Tulasnella sp. 417]